MYLDFNRKPESQSMYTDYCFNVCLINYSPGHSVFGPWALWQGITVIDYTKNQTYLEYYAQLSQIRLLSHQSIQKCIKIKKLKCLCDKLLFIFKDELWLHVRSLGNWTNKLYDHFSDISNETNESSETIPVNNAAAGPTSPVRTTVNRKMSNLGIIQNNPKHANHHLK